MFFLSKLKYCLPKPEIATVRWWVTPDRCSRPNIFSYTHQPLYKLACFFVRAVSYTFNSFAIWTKIWKYIQCKSSKSSGVTPSDAFVLKTLLCGVSLQCQSHKRVFSSALERQNLADKSFGSKSDFRQFCPPKFLFHNSACHLPYIQFSDLVFLILLPQGEAHSAKTFLDRNNKQKKEIDDLSAKIDEGRELASKLEGQIF